MLQIDNINTIEKLENQLSELQQYSIDISSVKSKLQEVIEKRNNSLQSPFNNFSEEEGSKQLIKKQQNS